MRKVLFKSCFVACFLSALTLQSFDVLAATGAITGKVQKLRTHQYLTGSSWDGVTWFCLESNVTVGSCPTSSCNGATKLVIARNAESDLFSLVLAARVSEKEITVHVDDSYKYLDACLARVIDL
ncbi:hypothetical protein [Vibrio europaeus]|uniref:hypothetical protein n=1 Tax=Vibrio europaeus TaxID=300876 RepID=UPI00233F7943|nr:hypothetical protein [Vibrio europaeus]MDC5820044.1 hypothetical protein [Vibrio europaeus]MDC5854002.1 hypothetical protein [Vibrio europaeus]MDC5868953.1 hypothetical protein [Vibrio europaeus]